MLTRRQFFKRAGAFAALFGLTNSRQVAPASADFTALAYGATFGVPPESALLGRLFAATDLRTQPLSAAPSLKKLPADSLHAILGVSEDGWWYKVAEGYLPREAMQPILPYEQPPQPTELHKGYYQVIAPTTVLRTACTPYARINARFPFGSVIYVHDWLTDDNGQVWYALTSTAEGKGMFGWANALHFQRWQPQRAPLQQPALWLDTEQHTLSVYEGETFIGKTAACTVPLPHDTATLRLGSPCTHTFREAPYLCMWQMSLFLQRGARLPLYGVNWHNRFGTTSQTRAIELPILAARQLYEMLGGAPGHEAVVIVS
ncbi:MAG: hypothetical protein NZ571_12410 [Anaerolineae bacterium]|nr:hypothetical protein [Anaerolineae bacterium]